MILAVLCYSVVAAIFAASSAVFFVLTVAADPWLLLLSLFAVFYFSFPFFVLLSLYFLLLLLYWLYLMIWILKI